MIAREKLITLLSSDNLKKIEDLLDGVLYEEKGVLFSEMCFLFLCSSQLGFSRIIESGRARGQSTLLLAKMFPDREIISIEHDSNSPDVDIAKQRLEGFGNVHLKFGNSIEIIPKLIQHNDIVLIDGPKGYRGVRLALKLLKSKKPLAVFLHDTTKNTSIRNFLERNIPNILYSDDLQFSQVLHTLDNGRVTLPEELKVNGKSGYGFSLAYIPFDCKEKYGSLLFKSIIAGAFHRWFGM